MTINFVAIQDFLMVPMLHIVAFRPHWEDAISKQGCLQLELQAHGKLLNNSDSFQERAVIYTQTHASQLITLLNVEEII